MLKLKTHCEKCHKSLPNEAEDAMICSFECTYCKDCVKGFNNICPNCGGGFQPRPIRPEKYLKKYPAGVDHDAVCVFRTNSKNKGFQELVHQLDQYLGVVDGSLHEFYDQYNQIEDLEQVVILMVEGKTVACGAFKEFDKQSVEIKRMFTSPDFRGFGLASKVLSELENWAIELGFQRSVLETGKTMIDAISFYQKLQYQIIENYGQYQGVDNSVCFHKKLT